MTKWDLSQEGKVGFKSKTQCNTAYSGGLTAHTHLSRLRSSNEVITCIATE